MNKQEKAKFNRATIEESLIFRSPLKNYNPRLKRIKRELFASFVREACRNAISYGAKNVSCFSLDLKNISNLPFVAICTDAKPFKDLAFMQSCMRSHTSGGDKGVQGDGIKFAANALSKHPIIIFASKNLETNTWFMAQCKQNFDSKLGGHASIEAVSLEHQELILNSLSDHLNKFNVITLATYEPEVHGRGEIKFPSIDLANYLTQYMSDCIEQLNIDFYPGLDVIPDCTNESHKEQGRHNYRRVRLQTKDQFNEAFLYKSHVFEDVKFIVNVEEAETKLQITATLEVFNYDGLMWRNDNETGDRRGGYIDKRTNTTCRNVLPIKQKETDIYNTFVQFKDAFTYPCLTRLNKEPVGSIPYIDDMGVIFNAALFDKHGEYEVDNEQSMPWYAPAQKHKEDGKSLPKRRPFQKAILSITKVVVLDSSEGIAAPSQLDLAMLAVGTIDESFMVEKKDSLRTLLEKCCHAIKDNPKYASTLEDLRNTCKLVCPKAEIEGFHKVHLFNSKKKKDAIIDVYENHIRRTKVKAEVGRDVTIECDLKIGNTFIHGKDYNFKWCNSSGDILKHCKIEVLEVQGTGTFSIKIPRLLYQTPEDEWIAAQSEEEWLEKSNLFSHMPIRDVFFIDENTGKLFKVSLKVELPLRKRAYTKSINKKEFDFDFDLDGDELKAVDVVQFFEPATQPVKILNDSKVIINANHSLSIPFKKKVDSEKYEKLYHHIRELAFEANKNFKYWQSIVPKRGRLKGDSDSESLGFSQPLDFYLTQFFDLMLRNDELYQRILNDALKRISKFDENPSTNDHN